MTSVANTHGVHTGRSEELFYQLGLRQFGNFNFLKLAPPPPVHDLVHLAVEENLDIIKAGLDPRKIGDVSSIHHSVFSSMPDNTRSEENNEDYPRSA